VSIIAKIFFATDREALGRKKRFEIAKSFGLYAPGRRFSRTEVQELRAQLGSQDVRPRYAIRLGRPRSSYYRRETASEQRPRQIRLHALVDKLLADEPAEDPSNIEHGRP
jgi:hypothetical protein